MPRSRSKIRPLQPPRVAKTLPHQSKIRPKQLSPTLVKLQQITLTLASACALFLVLYYLISHFFVITHVTCTLNQSEIPCSQSLNQAVQNLQGQPMIFFNLAHELQQLQAPNLHFSDFTYHKVFPNQLHVSFNFPPTLYQLSPDGQNFYAFDQFGGYTITPPPANVLQIRTLHEPTATKLRDYQVDQFLHQKFLELEHFTHPSRAAWLSLELFDLNDLRVTTPKATYILDLFSLDENLQKLDFLEQNWLPDENGQLVDLRLRLPVIK